MNATLTFGLDMVGSTAVVVGRMFGGDGCHARIKGAELSYKLDYLITAALFFHVCPVFIFCYVRPDRQGLSVPISEVYLHRPYCELISL